MSNYRIYAGNKKALVFPIMGDGYVHLDYSKHIPQGPDGAAYSESTHGIEVDETADDDDAKYGLWSLADSFTMESIITPYDVNGFGHRLITDYISGGGTPTLATKYNSASLELPLDKFYSPRGQLGTGNSSRTSAYFSHELVAYLAVAITNTTDTTLTLSNIDNIVGGTNIRIGNEQMEVVSMEASYGGANPTIVVARAQNGTTATSHSLNAEVYGDNRINHKMTIFHNETCQFYLKNMTRTTMNQPAEYKLGCVIKGKDGNGHIRTVTVQSIVPVITANEEYFGKTVEQTESVDEVFGKPVYFGVEDVVRYHKKINTSSNQIYAERFYHNAVLVSGAGSRAVFGDLSSGDGNKIALQGTTWAAGLSAGDYIKVIGSGNNDGHYKVKEKHDLTIIEVEPFTSGVSVFTNESVAFISDVLAIHYQTRHFQLSFNDGNGAYYQYDSDQPDVTNLDMSPHIWKGCNLYAQVSSTGVHSASLEHGKQPTYLGYIANIGVNSSSNRSDVVSMAKCKLTKPIRTTTETIIHVDDASKLSVGGTLWNNTEPMVIRSIEKNKITVVRGNNPMTTSLDSYGLTGATNANYLISSKEEDMFSRTLYCSLPDTGFTNGLKIVDGSGNSLANSDEYGAHLLGDTWKEASYLLRPFHLAMAYDSAANRISLFLDGKELDTEIFSEGKIRFASIVGDGSATATVTTQDNHGLTTNDWIKLEETGITNLDGIWKVTVITDNTFSINCVNALNESSSFNTSNGTLTDVTIRTTVNFRTFELDATDCYLGSNGNENLQTRRGSQFMGEMHEFAITKGYKDRFNSFDTLVPNFRNTLVYFRFEGDKS